METTDLEQKAFQISLRMGFAKGVLFALIPVMFTYDKPILAKLGAVFVGICLGLLFEYFSYYRPNIVHHKILLKRLGDTYQKDLNVALEEIGLTKMLQQLWFVNKYKEIWDI